MFSKLQCSYLYKKNKYITGLLSILKNTIYFRFNFLLKCNLHSIFTEGDPRARTWGGPGKALWAFASLMPVQLQSRTLSVDPAVENYFCNAVHLASEVSYPPRDVSTVAKWRPRKRPRVLWSVSIPTVLPNVQIDSHLVDCEITPRTMY